MKKTICLILAICMIIGFRSYCFALDTTEPSFSATVITCRYVESTDKYSFCAVGDVYGNGRRDPFTFGISREKIVSSHLFYETLTDDLKMGQIITVYFSGQVMESYPMQIVPSFIVVEEETEELTDAEKYQYLSMFYTDEWISDNGYAIVPECDEDTTPPSEFDEEDDGGVVLDNNDPTNDSDWVCGVPLEGDENSYLAQFTSHYLEGFVVASEMLMNDVEDDSPGYASIYFYPYYNFESKAITPVRIDVSEDKVALIGIDFWEIDSGINLKIYCSYESKCVPVENEIYYRLDGEVLTIEKLEGFTDNYNDYVEYFWKIDNNEYEDNSDIDTDDGGEVLIEETDPSETIGIDEPIVEAPIVKKKSEAQFVALIIACLAITALAVFGGIKLIKKK